MPAPFFKSRFLGQSVDLADLHELTDHMLRTLSTEVNSVQRDCSASLREMDPYHDDWGTVQKLLRVANDFQYGIEQELTARQRKESVLMLFNQLREVTAERDALREQLGLAPEQEVG